MKNILRFFFSKKQVATDPQDALAEAARRHSAGATVTHAGPFSGLQPCQVADRCSKDFFEKWVLPFYMGNTSCPQDFLKHYAPIRSELNQAVFLQLFGEFNWRTRIVGAFFAAIEKRVEFRDVIGGLLLKSEVCSAGKGYCLALASFEDEQSAEYLKKYLAYYLTQKDLWFDQGDAMAALAWIDARRGTNEVAGFMQLWREFTADKENWQFERSVQWFSKEMEGIQAIRQGVGIQ